MEIINLELKTLQSDLENIAQGQKVITCDTPSHASDHLYQNVERIHQEL